MASIEIAGAIVAVEDTAQIDRQWRPVYAWSVTLADGQILGSGEDLKGPRMGPEPSEREMLGTLLVFMATEEERVSYGGGDDALFDTPVTDWICENISEIESAMLDLEETEEE